MLAGVLKYTMVICDRIATTSIHRQKVEHKQPLKGTNPHEGVVEPGASLVECGLSTETLKSWIGAVVPNGRVKGERTAPD